jgi:DNA-binding NarL/FixJ family response regulator
MSITSQAGQAAATAMDQSPLTPREMDVLRLMADGLTTRDIAAQLGMRFKTAACHRNRILQKLAVKSTVSAVRWAFRQGLIAL